MDDDHTVKHRGISADEDDPGRYYMFAMPESQIEDLRTLMTTHGIDPGETKATAYDVIAGVPILTFTRYLTNEHGLRYLTCGHDADPQSEKHAHYGGCQPATKDTDVPLRTALPDWWRPAPSLTRLIDGKWCSA